MKSADTQHGEVSYRSILIGLLAGICAIGLMACSSDDDDDDDDAPVSIDGNEGESSGSLEPDERVEYWVLSPEEADGVSASASGGSHMLGLNRHGGGSCSMAGGTCSMNNVGGENEWTVSVENISDEAFDYEVSVWLSPDDQEYEGFEMERVDEDDDRGAADVAETSEELVEDRSDIASTHLPIIADVLDKAAGQEQEKQVYDLSEDGHEFGEVTVLVKDQQGTREVRFYGNVGEFGAGEKFATKPDAPMVFDSHSGELIEGRFWSFAEGALSHGRAGQDTGTPADLQVVTEPGPFTDEVQIEEMERREVLEAR